MLVGYQRRVMLHPGGHYLVEIHAIYEIKGHFFRVSVLVLFMQLFVYLINYFKIHSLYLLN